MPIWKPQPGPQELFLRSPADDVFYGGAAGGGKSDALLVEAVRDVYLPSYHALLLRRTYPELLGKGSGLIPRSEELYGRSRLRGVFDRTRHIWRFPSGATIGFGSLERNSSVYAYHSAQFAFIGFDELTTFHESQFLYMLSRLRSPAGIAVRVRSAGNPGGVGHAWVRRRYVERLRPYEIKWFKRATAENATEDNEVETHRSDPDALSRQFIPARVFDNPALLERDPGYLRRLKALDPVARRRLLDGDWWVANTGAVYNTFSEENITRDEPLRGLPIHLAFDDGYHDPRVMLFMQQQGDRILIFDEFYHTQHLDDQCVAEVVAHCRARGWPLPELAVGSPEAGQLHTLLRRANIVVRSMATPIVEGIAVVRRLILDGQGFRALRVHPRCTHLLQEIQHTYQYGSNSTDRETPQDGNDHCADALRYWAWLRYRNR